VLNIGDTISINHNWGNEFNLAFMYDRLQTDLANVRHALRDVTDMDDFAGYVQMVLKADSGTNYREFFDFIAAIADIYLLRVQGKPGGKSMDAFDPYFCSVSSVSNALRRIRIVLQNMLEDPGTRSVDGLADAVGQLLARLPPSD
ncbi:JmjC domain-containing protein 4, partial [Coemansia sp. RSA 486]